MRGPSKKLQSRLKAEFGRAVATLEVPDSAETWTSTTKLCDSVGGFFVSLQINLERAERKCL